MKDLDPLRPVLWVASGRDVKDGSVGQAVLPHPRPLQGRNHGLDCTGALNGRAGAKLVFGTEKAAAEHDGLT